MRNTTTLKPKAPLKRSSKDIMRWHRHRARWMARLEPSSLFQRLFDHLPGIFFFAKDREGHTMFASRSILERYQMRDESEMLGLTDFDINPNSMAESYVSDDARLLTGAVRRIQRIELWFDRQGMPEWFLVTKLPLLDKRDRPQGVMGILRRPAEHERRLPVFQIVAKAVDVFRRDYTRPLIMAEVAKVCGQSLRQLQRRFQTAFGITPQEFLIKTRVLAACRLLQETELSAGEVATRCGFVDQSSFTRHFRKRTGMTPANSRAKFT